MKTRPCRKRCATSECPAVQVPTDKHLDRHLGTDGFAEDATCIAGAPRLGIFSGMHRGVKCKFGHAVHGAMKARR